MRKRNILTAALALTAAAYIARGTAKTLAEWARYEKIREMSDEGPLTQEFPELVAQTIRREGDFLRELATFALRFPYELYRYLRMESL